MEFKIRSIKEILDRMKEISQSLKDDISDDLVEKLFNESLSLMLEIRVPRMPETKEELKDILESSMSGETYSAEEVFIRIRKSAILFNAWKEEYSQAVESHNFEKAANLLLDKERGPSWQRHPDIRRLESGIYQLSPEKITFESRRDGMALLGAMLILHDIDPESWKRR
jgi:hypothetical protein